MTNKTVDGDNLDGLWDAISNTDPFEVCFDEMFEGCYTAPGFGSWGAVILIILELLFWLVAIRFGYKRIKGKKASRLKHGGSKGRYEPPTYDYGDSERGKRRLTRSPFPPRKVRNQNDKYARSNRDSPK